MFFRNTRPFSRDLYIHMPVIHLIATGGNSTGSGTVLYCIFDQVHQYLPYFELVCIYIQRGFRTFLKLKPGVRCFSMERQLLIYIADKLLDGECFLNKGYLSGFEL